MKSGTCIVGISQDGVVWLGSDSLETYGDYFIFDCGTKLFSKPKAKMIMGGAGSSSVLDVIRFSFQPPKHEKAMNDYEYMTTIFVKVLYDCLENESALERKSASAKDSISRGSGDEDNDIDLLIGYNGRLYWVTDNSATPISCEFMAIGSGKEVAVGSLYTTNKTQKNPERRLLLALSASEFFINSVRRPFYIINSAGYEKVYT